MAIKFSKPINSIAVDTFEKLNPNDMTAGISNVTIKRRRNGSNIM